MKKIGIIGGAGPLASALLYESLVYEAGAKVPEIFLINYPFTRGLTLEEGARNGHKNKEEILYCIDALQRLGADIALLACNTLHLILKEIPPSLPFFSLPGLVEKAARAGGHKRLLILGTQNTCRKELYRFAGCEALYPHDQSTLDGVIDRILTGIVLEEDSRKVSEIIAKTDAEGVVLGCTDFSVLHHRFPLNSEKTIYDSIKIAAKTTIGLL
jgi:aspartate racemase